MADPLAQTFQLLTTTANPHAGELLVAAMDVPLPGIQSEAVRSVVSRGGVREQMEAIRRYPLFPKAIQQQLEENAGSLVPAIRQCLQLGRGDLEKAALELARAGETFGIVETLLEILKGERTNLREEIGQTLRHLVNRLYEHLHGLQEEDKPPLRNAAQIQYMMLMALDQSLTYFQDLSHADVVVEAVLSLGGAGHAVTQKLLTQGSLESRSLARELLLNSRHPGVMRFVLDSVGKPFPPSRVLDALQQRDDPEFLLATLRWVPKRWTGARTKPQANRRRRLVERKPGSLGTHPGGFASRAGDLHLGHGVKPREEIGNSPMGGSAR